MHSLHSACTYTNTNCTAHAQQVQCFLEILLSLPMSTYCLCTSKSLQFYKLCPGKTCWAENCAAGSHVCKRNTSALGETLWIISQTTRFGENNFFQVFQTQEIIREFSGIIHKEIPKLVFFQLDCPLIILKCLNMFTFHETNTQFFISRGCQINDQQSYNKIVNKSETWLLTNKGIIQHKK